MTTKKTVEAGRLIADAWRAHRTLDRFPDALFPRDRAEAAAIQVEMAGAIGERVVGWKVAGVPGPMVGRVFESSLYRLPARLPAVLSAHAPMIECEMGFELRRELPPRRGAYSADEVAAAAELRLMIEIVGTRFTRGKHLPDDEVDRLEIIADNAAGTALCIGPALASWREMRLLEVPVELRIDGGAPAPGSPPELRTEPFEILLWLVNELSERGIGIAKGQYVTTGAANVLQPIRPGNEAVATYGDIATLCLTMDTA